MSDPETGAPVPVEARPLVAVVDYGAGNLVSIGQALDVAGAAVRLATGPDDLDGASAVVVPGVGAAGAAMRRLHRAGLVEPIRDWVAAGRPYLGICLGLQLLFEGSDEDGAPTLGLLAGRTVLLRDAPTLPHIGWNEVEPLAEHPLFDGIPPGSHFYFVHSYAPAPADGRIVLARTTHGAPFVSAIARGAVLGLQFHPEKSAAVGLRLLSNFVAALPPSGQAAGPLSNRTAFPAVEPARAR